METEFDPRLKKVMSEIEAILKREDIGGFVTLASRTHAEYKLFMETSWSAVRKIEKDGREAFVWQARQNRRRIASESGVDESETGHLVFSTRDTCGVAFMLCEQLKEMISKHADVEHKVLGGLVGKS